MIPKFPDSEKNKRRKKKQFKKYNLISSVSKVIFIINYNILFTKMISFLPFGEKNKIQ